jgi:serine/threonine protein kinase
VHVRRYSGEMVDLWSCGVVLVALLAGWLPWQVPSLVDPDYAAWAAPRHGECSWVAKTKLHDAYDPLLIGILNPSVADRWDMKMIQASSWFQQRTELTALMGDDGLIREDTRLLRVEDPSFELSGSTQVDTTPVRGGERDAKRARVDTEPSQADSAGPMSPPERGVGASQGRPCIKRESCFTSRLNVDDTVKRCVRTHTLVLTRSRVLVGKMVCARAPCYRSLRIVLLFSTRARAQGRGCV